MADKPKQFGEQYASIFQDESVVAAYKQRGLFRMVGSYETAAVHFRQPIAAWVESFHARNGFSRNRMEPQAAAACDAELRAAVLPYFRDGLVDQQVAAQILWGFPRGVSI